jgi:hypothetical protein
VVLSNGVKITGAVSKFNQIANDDHKLVAEKLASASSEAEKSAWMRSRYNDRQISVETGMSIPWFSGNGNVSHGKTDHESDSEDRGRATSTAFEQVKQDLSQLKQALAGELAVAALSYAQLEELEAHSSDEKEIKYSLFLSGKKTVVRDLSLEKVSLEILENGQAPKVVVAPKAEPALKVEPAPKVEKPRPQKEVGGTTLTWDGFTYEVSGGTLRCYRDLPGVNEVTRAAVGPFGVGGSYEKPARRDLVWVAKLPLAGKLFQCETPGDTDTIILMQTDGITAFERATGKVRWCQRVAINRVLPGPGGYAFAYERPDGKTGMIDLITGQERSN